MNLRLAMRSLVFASVCSLIAACTEREEFAVLYAFAPAQSLPAPSRVDARCGFARFDPGTLEMILGSASILQTKGMNPSDWIVARTYARSDRGAIAYFDPPALLPYASIAQHYRSITPAGLLVTAIQISDGFDYYESVRERSIFVQYVMRDVPDFEPTLRQRAARADTDGATALSWFEAVTPNDEDFCK